MDSDAHRESAPARSFAFVRRLSWVAFLLATLSTAASLINANSWKADGITMLWPSNGLLLGVLLRVPRRQWPAFFAVGFLVDFGVNCALEHALGISAYLSGCNMLEVAIAAVLLYRVIAPNPDLSQRKQLMSLFVYGVILAPAVASFLASFQMESFRSPSLLKSLPMWFTSDALGIATITPLYLYFSREKPFSGRSWMEIAALLGLLCGISALVFWQARFPLLFLILPCLLLLGVRLGLSGSALGLLLVSIIGGLFTGRGRGPIGPTNDSPLWIQDLLLQFFIAISMVVLYVVEIVIAEGKRLRLNLEASEARFRLLAEVSRDIIVLTDLRGERRYVSPAAAEVLGWMPEELLGQDYRQIVHPQDIDKMADLLEECRSGRQSNTLQYRCRKKDGTYLWMEANLRLYHDGGTGEPIGFVNVVRDISRRKAAEEELNKAFLLVENLASVDGLTGVANRRRLDQTLEREWLRAMRNESDLSLLLIDVDHFKAYNDIYGHLCGDTCLRQIAKVVKGVIHRSGDLLARYGGEEFVVVLPTTDSRGAQRIAEQIRLAVQSCAMPHAGNAHEVITVSIGCATQTPGRGSVCTGLLEAADCALYQAKSGGRNRIEVASADSALRYPQNFAQ